MALDNKTKSFNIDKKQNIFNLKAKQNDTDGARSFTFKLIKDNQIFNLTGLTAMVGGNKADGKKIFNNVKIIDAAKGIVEMELTTEMLTVAGIMNLELILMQGSTRLSTLPFEIEIIPSATGYNAIISSDEFKALTEAITTAEEYGQKLKQGTEKIELQYAEKLNQIDSQLSDIVQNNIPSDFKKGTSFFCQNDLSIQNYLLDDVNRILNYKKCGINYVLIAFSYRYENNIIVPNISMDMFKKAYNYLVTNGFKVGIKFQDGLTADNVNYDNHDMWFVAKEKYILEFCRIAKNPFSINIANEIPNLTNDIRYKERWVNMYKNIKNEFPNTLITIHTYFSDFYYGRTIMADIVDAYGINYYPYTTDNPVPTIKEVKKAIYKPIRGKYFIDTMEEYSQKYEKYWFISEWGTASFEYQCKNPSKDWIPTSQKVINPLVQANYISSACELFPYLPNCKGTFLWSSNCWRNLNTPFEKTWAWDESEETIKALSKVWGGKYE